MRIDTLRSDVELYETAHFPGLWIIGLEKRPPLIFKRDQPECKRASSPSAAVLSHLLVRQFVRLQRNDLGFYRPTVRALVGLERGAGDSWMNVDDCVSYRPLTLRTGHIDKQHERHGEFLSRPAKSGHSKGSNLVLFRGSGALRLNRTGGCA